MRAIIVSPQRIAAGLPPYYRFSILLKTLTFQEEGIVRVPGGMLLRLEQRVKIPEGGLDESIGRHLLETHLEKDLAELLAHLHQGVQMTTRGWETNGIEVVFLEGCGLPFTAEIGMS